MARPKKKNIDVNGFLADLHKLPNTTRTYRHILGQFEKFLDGRPPTEDEARAYIRSLTEKGLAPGSIVTHGRALRHYFKWSRIPLHLELPTTQRKLAPWLDMNDIKKILKACRTPMETALVMVLFDSAIRACELRGLKRKDIDWEKGFLYVRRKGGREQWYPIGRETLDSLDKYLEGRKPGIKEVFPFTYFELRAKVMELGKRAKVTPRDRNNLNLHSFRHARAATLYEQGVDITVISRLLGHASITTTMIYTEIKPEAFKEKVPSAFG